MSIAHSETPHGTFRMMRMRAAHSWFSPPEQILLSSSVKYQPIFSTPGCPSP
jgi:hypothetical protein